MTTSNLTRINVPLARDEAQIIVDLARKEFRHPREQARLLLCEALRARGLIADAPTPNARPTNAAPRNEVEHATENL